MPAPYDRSIVRAGRYRPGSREIAPDRWHDEDAEDVFLENKQMGDCAGAGPQDQMAPTLALQRKTRRPEWRHAKIYSAALTAMTPKLRGGLANPDG